MTWEEYLIRSQITVSYPQHRIDYSPLALAGELGELVEAYWNNDAKAMWDEAGDMFWYIADLCRKWNINLAMNPQTIPNANKDSEYILFMVWHVGKICNHVKKVVRAEKHLLDQELLKKHLSEISRGLLYMFGYTTVALILEQNTAKLEERMKQGTLKSDTERTPDQVS